jgi:phosphatidylinositol alpha-mannosyltransferase
VGGTDPAAAPGAGAAASPALRIALVCPYSLSRPGGVQGQVLGLARTLEFRGHLATVYAPIDDLSTRPRGVSLVPSGRSVALPANGSVAPVSLSSRAALHGVREIRSAGYDVIHVHEPFTPGLSYGLLTSSGLPPLVATFHRSCASPLYTALRPLAARVARRLTVRCAVSEAAAATASTALDGEYLIGFNGVELAPYLEPTAYRGEPSADRFGAAPGAPCVLFLGRHEERKGLAVLLDAFTRLRPGPGPDPVLWIAGDGPQTESLRRRHPPSTSVRWLGLVSEEEKVARLLAADILCAPSLGGESFGMVLLEAMAARTTVVASAIDGYRDAAAGHAVLVPPGQPELLAEALAGVLAGPTDRQPISEDRRGPGPAPGTGPWLEEARAWAEHWSMDRLVSWYEDVYARAMVSR